jgi:hypothetical protein
VARRRARNTPRPRAGGDRGRNTRVELEARNTASSGRPDKASGNRTDPRQLVIAATVASANGRIKAERRLRPVVSLRLEATTLDMLDAEAQRRCDAMGGWHRNRPTRTMLVEEAVRSMFGKTDNGKQRSSK